MTQDSIKITILEDGTIKVETDEVGQANHASADRFLAEMARLAGGQTETTKKPHTHSHHGHGITHTH